MRGLRSADMRAANVARIGGFCLDVCVRSFSPKSPPIAAVFILFSMRFGSGCDYMNKTVLAVDLGGTNMRMAAVGSDGNILFQTRTSTPGDVNPGGLIGLFSRLAAECRDAIGHEFVICAIAAGVPANINSEGILHNLPNLPSIEGMNLKSDLERAFGVPAVLENDATAAAIGEDWLGASRSVK